MTQNVGTALPLLLPLAFIVITSSSLFSATEKEAIELALNALTLARNNINLGLTREVERSNPWLDCEELYENSKDRIIRLVGRRDKYGENDARTWLSAASTSHKTCMDGLREMNVSAVTRQWRFRNVGVMLRKALASLPTSLGKQTKPRKTTHTPHKPSLLNLWDASTDNADITVAQDGSGNYKTINEAVQALHRDHKDDRRIIVYVKSGVYQEYVEIERNLKNVMFVGDGIDKTIVTGSHNVPDGFTTYRSATFGVAADGFWARGMTFENTAGPEKHQAVALRVESDRAIFYRCSFKGYQDTLFVHSNRQFYRDCHIYGTIDFIFGNAATVVQNSEIFVRKPMGHQANMITAQGRDDPNQNTGISIHSCRVRPTADLEPVKGSFKSYLGRPWQRYSRTVVLKSDLDGLIHPEGWARWTGDFGLDTLYYGEYMNVGEGADTRNRVSWRGFHVLRDESEAWEFGVDGFIDGGSWIAESGVPFWGGI